MHAGGALLTRAFPGCSLPLGQQAEVRLLQHPRIQHRYACVEADSGREWQLSECQQLGRACVEAEVRTTLLVSALDGCLLPLLSACFAVSVRRCFLCEDRQPADDSCNSAARSEDATETTHSDGEICLNTRGEAEAAQCIFHNAAGSDSELLEAARSNACGVATQELFEISVAARKDQAPAASSGPLANALQEGRELHLFMLAGQSNMAGRGRLDELPDNSCLGPDGFPGEQSLRDSIFFHSPSSGWLPA